MADAQIRKRDHRVSVVPGRRAWINASETGSGPEFVLWRRHRVAQAGLGT